MNKKTINERNNAIRDCLSKGISQADCARIFKISRNTINLIAMKNIANEDEIKICIEWLSKQKITKRMNKRYNSYSYKHIIEKVYSQYISNDSLVEAVKRINMDYELSGESGRFVYLPLSNKNFI